MPLRSVRSTVSVSGRSTFSAAQGCGRPSGPMRIRRSHTISVAQEPWPPGMLNGFRLVGGAVEFRITSFCDAERRDAEPGPGVADADAGLRHRYSSIPDRLVVRDDVLRMHLEAVRLIVVDQFLRLHDQRPAFVDVEFLALRLRQLVIGGIVVADEVVAVGGIGRDEQVVGQFIRIAALGPADHLPGGGVPALALVPDDLIELLARPADAHSP